MKQRLLSLLVALAASIGFFANATTATIVNYNLQGNDESDNLGIVTLTMSESYFVPGDDTTWYIYKDDATTPYATYNSDYWFLPSQRRNTSLTLMFEPITEDGVYKFVVPAGAVMNNDTKETNTEFSVEITQGNPASSVEIAVGQIDLCDPDYPYLAFTFPNNEFNKVNSSYQVSVYYNDELQVSFDESNTKAELYNYWGTFWLVLPSPMTYNGTYTIVFGAGSFYNSSSLETSPELSLDVEVTTGQDPVNVSIEPAPGAYHRSLGFNVITVKYPTETITEVDANLSVTVTYDGADYKTIAGSSIQTNGGEATIKGVTIQKPGEYIVTIPAAIFTLQRADGSTFTNDEMTLTYIMNDNLTWTVVPDPETPVEELKEVVITFSKPVVAGQEFEVGTNPYWTESSRVFDPEFDGKFSLSDDGTQLTITFTPAINAGGIWGVVLDAGVNEIMIADGEEFKGITAVYTVENTIPVTSPQTNQVNTSIQETQVFFTFMSQGAEKTDNFCAYYYNGSQKVDAKFVSSFTYDMETRTNIVVAPETPLTSVGTWTLVIEEGSLLLKNFGKSMLNTRVEVNMDVEGGFIYTINPTPGSAISRFDNFSVDFTPVSSIGLSPDASKEGTITIYHKHPSYDWWIINDIQYPCTAYIKQEGGKASIVYFAIDEVDLMEQILALDPSFTYSFTLKLPAGAIVVNGYPWEGGQFEYEFTMPEWVIYPYTDSVLEEIDQISVLYTGQATAKAAKSEIEVTVDGTAIDDKGQLTGEGPWEINFEEPLTEPGKYQILIDKAFTLDGKEVAMSPLAYLIEGDSSVVVGDVEISEVGDVETFTGITLTFNGYTAVELTENYSAVLTPATRAEEIVLNATIIADPEKPQVILTPAVDVPQGEYTMTVAQGSFLLTTADGKQVESEEITANYNVTEGASSVGSLFGETLNADVYGIDGTLIIRNADASAIQSLNAGIYILNGKKLIIR